MGYKQAPALAVMAVILLAAAADGQITGISVAGIVNCPSSGPGISVGLVLQGVRLNLNCTNLLGATVTVGQGITDTKGRFNITVPNLVDEVADRNDEVAARNDENDEVERVRNYEVAPELLRVRNDEVEPELQFKGPVTRLRAKKLQGYLQVLIRKQFEDLEDARCSHALVNVLTNEDQVLTMESTSSHHAARI